MAAQSFAKIEAILRKLEMEDCVLSFQDQRISPDIVGLLSSSEMISLGILIKSDMIKLRNECVKYGSRKPSRQVHHTVCGPPEFSIPENIIRNFIDDGFTIKEMSKLLSVSEKTVYRRMQKGGIAKI
ncbi:hypothetical protein KUTeg_012285 [Tegillarca granosa]|uniref:Uncharacterized protein n=1 Tax=Tegillarca granosa TaxID=220873 RepID=A0ABQ9F2L5_TEGGR|nr:hypothetical protein KUTeg_012285 [Tegillarca granosa]